MRIPFVRRCHLRFDDGREQDTLLVNLSVLGAYVSQNGAEETAGDGAWPSPGQQLRCRFVLPGNDQEVDVEAAVSWLNPRQQHPVHSLPPGFGVQFRDLPDPVRVRIEQAIAEYAALHPSPLET